MDMVDMDMVDMEMVDRDIVDQRNVMQRNLSHSWIQWTTGYGNRGTRKQSVAMVNYWVRHANCALDLVSCWCPFYLFEIDEYLKFQLEHQVYEKPFFTILEDSHFLQSVQMDMDGNLSLLRNIRSSFPQKIVVK